MQYEKEILSFMGCGETGIRTLGPPYGGQRFSRPPHSTALASLLSGERGIRTPGPLQVNGFQDRRNRPLCHLSGSKSTNIF